MNKDFTKITANYSFYLGLLGMFFSLFLQNGFYTGFVFGVLGIVCGVLSKLENFSIRRSTVGIVLSSLSLSMSLFTFYVLWTLFSNLRDPVMGAQFSEILLEYLKAFGISTEAFLSIIAP